MIRDRLATLRFTDESGIDSDVLEIVLTDHEADQPIAMPSTGAELAVAVGYDGQLRDMGLFVCDEVELAGWPGEMTIRARAAVQENTPAGKATLRTQKSREWAKGTKLGNMARKIATEHGMEAAVAQSLDSIALPHMAQADESDLHFLIRIARKYDGIVKPAAGRLVLAKRGETKSTSGVALPGITLKPAEVSRWRVVMSKAETAGMVVAYWHAVKQAKRHEVKVGSGEPVRRLKMYYPTEEMALAAARSELDRRKRGKVTISLSLPGRPDLQAEAPLILQGFRPGVDGDWIITRVEHSIGGDGYACTVEAEQPNDGADPAVEDATDTP